MKKNAEHLPEVFVSKSAISDQVRRLLSNGRVRRLGPRLYTTNMSAGLEDIVTRNLWAIIGLLAPGTVISHRTALENRVAPDNSIFLTGAYNRRLHLPGLEIHQIAGVGPTSSDMPFMESLHIASPARAYLENLQPSRTRKTIAKTVGREEVERRLAERLRISGEGALNRLRDEARSLAHVLDLTREFHELDLIVSALMRTRSSDLSAPTALAYSLGAPFDPTRLPIFDVLFAELSSGERPERSDVGAAGAWHNLAFFDAYFSNYIEGTEFTVDEAVKIIFRKELPSGRPADAHDIIGTYQIVGSRSEMKRRGDDFDGFIRLLKHRHATILAGRPEMSPGEFKTINNQAGATLFVPPDLVLGTLKHGYRMCQALSKPFDRALFMGFIISEVHPFTDGNGRIARAMMNAELVAGGQTRIIIPTVYRNEYIGSLKRLTNNRDAYAFVRVMDQAQRFVRSIEFENLDSARAQLGQCNAFMDPQDHVKLLIAADAV